MPEARDRIERPLDYSAVFLNRRSNGVLLDEPATTQLNLFGSPVQRLPSGSAGITGLGSMSRGRSGLLRGSFGIRRFGGRRGHTQFRMPQGRENMSLGVARRGRGRVLPSWYPRTPLRDVSAVIRAIERRRARMGEGVGRDMETPTPQQLGVLDLPLSVAQLEHNYSTVTPGPSVGFKRPWPPSTAKVHQILLDITRRDTGEEEEETLTPQKKLLNSIDKVEKVVMEEIQKMKSTPSAKRAERKKRVRTLMSMR